MNTKDNFTDAYLKSLNVIKQDEDKDEKKVEGECDTTDSKEEQGEVIVAGDSEGEAPEKNEQEEAKADEEASDDEEKDTQEQGEEESDEEAPTCFCFKTINKDLIDAINNGFDKVVFTVKSTDEDGNETTTDVEFDADAFEDFSECEQEEDEEEAPETDDLEISDDEDEDFGEEEEPISFESVFRKYYNSLISEEDETEEDKAEEKEDEEKCPECGDDEPCDGNK